MSQEKKCLSSYDREIPGYGTESLLSSRLSERSLSLQSESYHSTHSTLSNVSYDSAFWYKYNVQNPVVQNKPTSANVHIKSNVWEDNSLPARDNHRSSKRHVTPPSTSVTHVSKQSPIRESLDSRIERLLKQTDGKKLFEDLGAVSKQIGDVSVDNTKRSLMGPPLPWSDAPPLPPDLSSQPPLPETDDVPPPPSDEKELVLLSTPPSPFLNYENYNKWSVITNEIDSGKLTSLSDIPNVEAKLLEHLIPIKGVRLSSINWKANSMPPEKTYDSPFLQDKGDLTLATDELPIEIDDKMSLSSLSDGENKLEVTKLSISDNAKLPGTLQKPVNDVLSSSVPSSNFNNLYSSQSFSSSIYLVSDNSSYTAPPSYPQSFSNSGSTSYPLPPSTAAPPTTAILQPTGSALFSLPPPPLPTEFVSVPPFTPVTAASSLYPSPASASAGTTLYPSTVPASAGTSAYPPPPPTGSSLFFTTYTSQYGTQGVYAPPPLPPMPSTSVAPTIPAYYLSIPYLSSSSQTQSTTSYPMYPCEHVQMMARMGLWHPGMGSGISSAFQLASPSAPASTSSFSVSSQTPFAPTTFCPKSTALPSNIAEMVRNPPPEYPAIPPIRQMMPSPFPVYPQFTVPPPDIRDPHAVTVNGVLKSIMKDLKEVVKKEMCERIIQRSAFKRLDQWWDEKLHQVKKKRHN